MEINSELLVNLLGALLFVFSVFILAMKRIAALPLIAVLFFLYGALVIYKLEPSATGGQRYIGKNEARALKMFDQNCKQVNFIQANNTFGSAFGMTGKGSPVAGTVSTYNEDSYIYLCDSGVQYTLTYDIEKYRK